MYNPIQIANYFINKSFDTGSLLTPMKLLKLVYLAHGWNLGVTGNSLITEAAEAWKYGPVIPSVYNAFKKYGNRGISAMYDYNEQYPIDQNTTMLLDRVNEVYRNHNGLQLSAITHMENSPWDITWNKNNGKNKQSAIIPNDLIEEYYKNKLNSAKEA